MKFFLDSIGDDETFDFSKAQVALQELEKQVNAPFVGLGYLVRRLILAVIMGEHVLIEGYPGLAKTETAKTLAARLGLAFERIQFVPDLMPSDVIQRERLELGENDKASIVWHPGPVFTNLLLADEINRASPKTQAALLEVTEELQVTDLYEGRMVVRPRKSTDRNGEAEILKSHGPFYGEKQIDEKSFRGQQFTALATMNPIEQEGVYPLSEAQMDRFAFKLLLDYPRHKHLRSISRWAFQTEDTETVNSVHEDQPAAEIDADRNHAKALYFLTRLRGMLYGDEAMERWTSRKCGRGFIEFRKNICDLVGFTHLRRDAQSQDASGWAQPVADGAKSLEMKCLLKNSPDGDKLEAFLRLAECPEVLTGASPRGLFKLIRATYAHALMTHCVDDGRPLVPNWRDVEAVACDVLRHRIRLTPSSVAAGRKPDELIEALCKWLRNRRT